MYIMAVVLDTYDLQDFAYNLCRNIDIKRSLQVVNQCRQEPIVYLKPKQTDCVLSVDSEGNASDVLAILPTGYGKSLLFQLLPVYCQLRRGLTCRALIVSPLNAIIQQQKLHLGNTAKILQRTKLVEGGSDSEDSRSPSPLPAAGELNLLSVEPAEEEEDEDDHSNDGSHSSSSHEPEAEASLKDSSADAYQFYLGHPEDFLNPSVIKEFTMAKWADEVSHIFIDEAHCTVQWSEDFRPKYRDLDTLRSIFPKAAMFACTATATVKMQGEIKRLLNMRSPRLVSSQLDRRNIKYKVKTRPSQSGKFSVQESYTSVFAPLLHELKDMGTLYPKTIVYTGLKWCGFGGELGVKVLASGELTSVGVPEVAQFHAPLASKVKQDVASTVAKDNSPIRLLFATEAFGMGVDCQDIRHVVNAGPPSTLETYSQETGRAGRDGQPSEATLFYNREDLGRSTITPEMKQYCLVQDCRRQYLAKHFGLNITQVEPLHTCCDICEKACLCNQCEVAGEGSHESEEDESLSGKHIILEHVLNQYFSAVNASMQDEYAMDVSIITGLTPELATDISNNSAHLCGEDLLAVSFPYIQRDVIKTIVEIISKTLSS